MSDPLTYANSDEYVLVNPNDPKVGHLIYDAPMVDADTKQFIRDPETGKIKVYRMVIWGTKGLTQAQVEALITEKNATMVTKVTNIENRLNTVLNSDDTDLDQLSELVTEIKANRSNIALLVSDKATKEELQSAVNTINANLATVANKSNAIAVTNTPSQSLESGSGEIVPNTARLNTVDLSEIRNKYLTDIRSAFLGQIITSPIPLSDSCLHLLDGSVLSGSGIYKQFVDFIAELSTTNPEIFVTESAWQSSVSTYGECGKFVVDTVNETVRLPKLTSFIQATSTANELGDLVEAGVPNITGFITNMLSSESGGGTTGALSRSIGSASVWSPGQSGFYNAISFNASRSNAIYGNSNTVQPQSIKYYYYIVVGTVSKTPVQVDIDNVVTDLNDKADRSLSNVDSTANILMAHNAMPSHTLDTLTLGASGARYTAPADGYFTFHMDIRPNGYMHLATTSYDNESLILYQLIKGGAGGADGTNYGSYIPVKKGDILQVNYENIVHTYYFGFVYAVGSESEQV